MRDSYWLVILFDETNNHVYYDAVVSVGESRFLGSKHATDKASAESGHWIVAERCFGPLREMPHEY